MPEDTAGIRDRAVAAWSLTGDAMTAWVLAEMRRAGIACLLFKGAATHRLIYDTAEPRFSSDVDLLIEPRGFAEAERLLRRLRFSNRYDGESPEWADEHGDTWVHDSWPLPIDLHRRLWGFGASPKRVWSALYAAREPLPVSGVEVEVPGRPARALLLALHAAHHGLPVLKPVAELRLALAALPEHIWDDAVALAFDLEAAPGLIKGLELLPEGKRVLERIDVEELGPEVDRPAPRMYGAPPTTEGFVRLADAGSWRERGVLLWRELVPSRSFMICSSRHGRLARRGCGGLVAAYGARWAYLLSRGVPGFLAARRMRRG